MRFERTLLRVTEARDGSAVRLGLYGELDLSTRPQVEEALARAEEWTPATIEIDLSGLTFLDSTGVHMAIEAHERATAVGRELVLLPASPLLQRIFELTGTEQRLPFRGRAAKLPTGPTGS
jgi:anti-sigma B factor antagonist